MTDRASSTLPATMIASPTSLAAQAGLALVGAGLLALSAKVSVPFFPVPMTFQTLVVLMIGACFGPRLAAATIGAYLAEGAAGLPVFAGAAGKAGGLAYFAGPTGGFLIGFLAAAVLVGWLTRRGWGRTFASSAAMMFLGTVAIYGPGLLWLGAVVGWDKPVLAWGFYPFVTGDLLKLAIAALATPMLLRRGLGFRL